MCQRGSNKTCFAIERTVHISHVTVRRLQSVIASALHVTIHLDTRLHDLQRISYYSHSIWDE